RVARVYGSRPDEGGDRGALPVRAPALVPFGKVELSGQLDQPEAPADRISHACRERECHVVVAAQHDRERSTTDDGRGGAPTGLAGADEVHGRDGQIADIDQL